MGRGRHRAPRSCYAHFLLTGNSDGMVLLENNALAAAREAAVAGVEKLSALGATDHSRSVIGLWTTTWNDGSGPPGVTAR